MARVDGTLSPDRSFWETPLLPLSRASRLVVVSACTASKSYHPPGLLTDRDLDDTVRRLEGHERLRRYCLPAADMYTGQSHIYVRQAIELLRSAQFEVSHYIVSAGYGLIRDSELIAPYDVTFSGKSKHWIRERGTRLGVRSRLADVADGSQCLILILGRDYLEAMRLPLPRMSLTSLFAYVAPSVVSRLGSNVVAKPVGPLERRAIGAYSASAKEYRFLLDIKRELDRGIDGSNSS